MTPSEQSSRPTATSPEQRRGRGSRHLARTAGLLIPAALLLSGCAGRTITKTGNEVSTLYNIVLWMAAAVFFAVEAAIIYNVIRYRRRRRDTDTTLPPQIHGNTRIEVVWTAIPAVIIAALFVMSMVVLVDVNHEDCPPPPAGQQLPQPQPGCADLTVNVTGYQWQWSFQYFDHDGKSMGVTEGAQGQFSGPTLVLPVGERIHFNLSSADVIHSFFIPDFFFKRDVVPGRINSFEVTVDRDQIGRFYGQCAELCGDYHNAMTFQLQTMSPSDFESWAKTEAAKQAKAGSCSPTGSQLQLAAQAIHYDKSCLAAPANQAFTIEFDNRDAGVQHNVAILDKQGGGALFTGSLVPGPASATYEVSALKPGNYYFQCDVHPDAMNGSFVVK